MKIFVVSDTHFSHSNIIYLTKRPFSSVSDMDTQMIENWNSVVKNDDMVIFLGDFCLGNKESIKYFANKLNGHKIMIAGNHDRGKQSYIGNGFQDYKKYFIYPKEVSGFKHDILFMHKPIENLPQDTVQIHGHIHNAMLDSNMYNIKNYFNVSVENIGYTPIELNKIIETMDW